MQKAGIRACGTLRRASWARCSRHPRLPMSVQTQWLAARNRWVARQRGELYSADRCGGSAGIASGHLDGIAHLLPVEPLAGKRHGAPSATAHRHGPGAAAVRQRRIIA